MLFPKRRQTSILLQFSVLLLSLALIGCPNVNQQLLNQFITNLGDSFGSSVKVDPKDKTPPKVTLIIPDLVGTGEKQVNPGDQPITIYVEAIQASGNWGPFFVVASAEDPEGVQSVCIVSIAWKYCDCGEGATGAEAPLETPTCYTRNGRLGSVTTTKLWIPYLIDPVIFSCGQLCTGGGGIYFVATATNYSGQKSTTAGVTIENR